MGSNYQPYTTILAGLVLGGQVKAVTACRIFRGDTHHNSYTAERQTVLLPREPTPTRSLPAIMPTRRSSKSARTFTPQHSGRLPGAPPGPVCRGWRQGHIPEIPLLFVFGTTGYTSPGTGPNQRSKTI